MIIQSACEYVFSFRVREYIHYAPMQLHILFSKSLGKRHFHVRNVRHFYKEIHEKISRIYIILLFVALFKNNVGFLFKEIFLLNFIFLKCKTLFLHQ